MPGMDISTPFDPRIDRLSQKIQEIRERKGAPRDNTMDDAMNVVESNLGRQEAGQAEMSLMGLADEFKTHGAEAHALDPAKVASLISDPFED